jgi:hypothetical protein
MTSVGFPHSDISGSTPACDSPELFAANHVLHRLLTPRHPSCALSSLTTNLLWPTPNPKEGSPVVPRKLVDGLKPPKFRDTPSTRSRSKLHEGAQTRRIPSTLVLSQRHAFASSRCYSVFKDPRGSFPTPGERSRTLSVRYLSSKVAVGGA